MEKLDWIFGGLDIGRDGPGWKRPKCAEGGDFDI
jgi:hypothetical protein